MMRPVWEVIIHCAATRKGWMHGRKTSDKVAEIRRWHVEDRGWSDIGYHFVIDRDGTVAKGRPIERTGAHVRGHNTGSVGVCLIGGHGASSEDHFEDHFTDSQRQSMYRLVDNLKGRFGDLKISGHNQYANKGCPGFQVPPLFAVPVRDQQYIEPDTPDQSPFAALIAAILSIFGGKT